MDELGLATKLEENLSIPGLQVQVVWHEENLTIVLNRISPEHLNYNQITKRVVNSLVNLKVPPPRQILFYSRPLGEEATDWEKVVNIKVKTRPTEEIEELESPTKFQSIIEEQSNSTIENDRVEANALQEDQSAKEITEDPPSPLPQPKLSDFCFTRNKVLIKTDLPSPAHKVAENVKFFDELNESLQLELAPVLEDFFKNPDKTSLVSVPTELRRWFEDLKKLKDAEFKSQAIWLSRYCHDREKTMTEINKLFAALAEIEEAKQKELEPPPEPVNDPPQSAKRSVSSRYSNTVSHKPRSSQKFTPDELLFMIGGSLLIGAIGWFLWGTAATLGLFGWVAAIASIISGVGSILGSKDLKTISGSILLVIWAVFFFTGTGLIILWIEFLGWLIGLIAAGAVTTIVQSSGAESIISPKSLRLIVVFAIVILIGMVYAFTKPPSGEIALNDNTNFVVTGPAQGTIQVTISDNGIAMSNRKVKTELKLQVANQSSYSCNIYAISADSQGFFTENTDVIPSGSNSDVEMKLPEGLFRLQCDTFNTSSKTFSKTLESSVFFAEP